MAVNKTPPISTESTPRYHTTGAQGNHLVLKQAVRQTANPAMPNLPVVNFLVIEDGVGSIVLTQQNAADLATAITNFGSTGILS